MLKTRKYLWTYKELYDTYPHKDKVDKHTHRLVQRTFNNLLIDSMVEEGKVYKLPAEVGYLGIYTFPTRDQFNYQHYKETGNKTYTLNLHSDKLVAAFKYRRPKRFYPTCNIYRFKTARKTARALVPLIREKNYITKYFSYETYFD